MRLGSFTLPAVVAAIVVWTVILMGVMVGAHNAYEADTAAEVSIEVETHVDEVRGTSPKVDGRFQDDINGTQLGWLNNVLFSSEQVRSWTNRYVVVPGIWLGLTVGNAAAGVFYHHLLWVPMEVVNSVFRVAGFAPMVGLLYVYARHIRRLLGDLQ